MGKTIVTVLDARNRDLKILVHFDILSLEEAQRVLTANGYGDFKPIKIENHTFYSEIK